MDDWTILGIEETDNKDILRRAYMKQLALHNPEDDPEGFQRVRAAYERVLQRLTEAASAEAEDDSLPGRFMRRAARLYEDFSARIDAEAWKTLLTDEACVRLDLEDETVTRLLRFLMEHYYMPQSVWRVLNDHFDWLGRSEALRQNFPAGFIDFMISSAGQPGTDYRLFTYDGNRKPDTRDYDRWLYLYYELDNLLATRDIHEADQQNSFREMQAELEALPVKHVYYDLLCARILLTEGKSQEALSIVEPLAAQLPDDPKALFTYGLSLLAADNPAQAKEPFDALLAANPADFGAKKGLIDCYIAMNQYEEARGLLLEILDEYPFNPYALGTFRYVTEQLMTMFEEKHRDQPEDREIMLTLAKHYLNSFKYDECRVLLETLPPTDEHPRHYEYLADCYAYIHDYDRALALYEKNVHAVKQYRNYVKYISTLLDAGQPETALIRVEESLRLEDDDTLSKAYLYDNKGLALFALERYEEALSAYDDSLQLNGNTAHVYVHKAKTCQKLNRYAEAVELCEQANRLYPFITEAYTIQMEIFYDADLYDRMVELAEQAEQFHYESPRVQYFKACALRMKNEAAQAETILNGLLDAENDEGYRDYFHAELAYIALAREDYASALRNIEEAIRLNPEPAYRHTFLANTHRMRMAYDEALAQYGGLIDKWPQFIAALMGRGNTYFDMKEYEKALADYKAALAVNENNEQAFDRIIDTYLAENRYAEALPVAERETVIFDNMENNLRLAWLYDKNDQLDAAKAAYENTTEHFSDHDRPFTRYGYFCKNSLSQFEQAVALFKRSLELKADQPLLYSDIAYCLCQLKKYDEALRTIDEALGQYPDTDDLWIRRGFVLSYLKRHEESLHDLIKGTTNEEAIQDRWNTAYIYNRIGTKYELYGNNAEKALSYYKLAVERDDTHADAHKNIGDLYRYYFKNYKEALRYYHKKIQLEPNEADGYLVRAQAYALCWHFSAARKDFNKALSLYRQELQKDPDDLCLYAHMGDCYVGLGEIKTAIEHYQKAIEKAPCSQRCEKGLCDEAYFGLGRAYEKLKNFTKALECYETAVQAVNSVEYNLARDRLKKKLKR